jgi:hypothetical protein
MVFFAPPVFKKTPGRDEFTLIIDNYSIEIKEIQRDRVRVPFRAAFVD